MAMALTGDTATQKETFDVPVIARGTFLGGHQWSGKEADVLTGQTQRADRHTAGEGMRAVVRWTASAEPVGEGWTGQ